MIIVKIESSNKETVDTMENVLFTNIYENIIGKSKVSEVLPYLNWVSSENHIDLKKKFNKGRNLLVKSVMCN